MTGCVTSVFRKISKVEEWVPLIRKIRTNPALRAIIQKIKPVAQQVFLFLGVVLVGAAAGALIGTPGGAPFIILGATIGAASGGLAFLGVHSILYLIKRFGFPAHSHRTKPPLDLDNQKGLLTDDKARTFKKVINNKLHFTEGNQLKDHPWYAAWKNYKNYKDNDTAAKEHLWRRFQNGVSHGEAAALVKTQADSKPPKNGREFLEQISTKDIFYYQILELIREDLLKSNSPPTIPSLTNEIRSQESPFNHQELNDEQLFLAKMKAIMNQDPQRRPTCAILRLDKDTKIFHSIFLHLKTNKWSFYDPYSLHFTGFHENFNSEDDFLKNLFQHLRGYHSFARPCAPRFSQATTQWFYT